MKVEVQVTTQTIRGVRQASRTALLGKEGHFREGFGPLPTPQQSILLRCLDYRETRGEIANCECGPGSREPCSLWLFRMGRKCGSGFKLKAIRAYCLWGMCGSSQEVKLCPSETCRLWPYRLGRRPRVVRDSVS